MSIEKENFLRTKLIHYLQQLDPATPPRWGKMNVQQMIEHFAHDAVANANGHLKFDKIVLPAEEVEKMRQFMMTEKPFRENLRNPLMSEVPGTLRYNTIQAAIGALQLELIHFFEVFEKNHQLIILNPFFGELNFEENVQLLYKHGLHHLRQFGIEPLSS
jgi:hypothetical protein